MEWVYLFAVAVSMFCCSVEGQGTNSSVFVNRRVTLDNLPRQLTNLSESLEIGAFLYQVKCTDLDNDPIEYRMLSGDFGEFKNPLSGVLTLKILFDYEQERVIKSVIGCRDLTPLGFPRGEYWVDASFDISLLDANDENPQFNIDSNTRYTFSMREDDPVGTQIVDKIIITDADTDDFSFMEKIYLLCASPDPQELASLDDDSRSFCEYFDLSFRQISEIERYKSLVTLTLKKPLDYEQGKALTTVIVAVNKAPIDGGDARESRAGISVDIIDAQDNPPLFEPPSNTDAVSESTPVGTTLAYTISARDGDLGSPRAIDMELIDDSNGRFSLSPIVNDGNDLYSARLVLEKQLDREEIASLEAGGYAFSVKAYELQNSTRTNATVDSSYILFVSDENDNDPEFENSNYEVNVIEPSGTGPVQIPNLVIKVEDKDQTSNAKFQVEILRIGDFYRNYSITPNQAEGFSKIGVVSLLVNDRSLLDYEVGRYRNQTLYIGARELSQVNFVSTSTVTIKLEDVNDNKPEFLDANGQVTSRFSANIREDVQVPYEFYTIRVRDFDSEKNGEIDLSLSSDADDIFVLRDRRLILTQQLDYEDTLYYTFTVLASDQGSTKQSAQIEFDVNVINVNDQKPVFSKQIYENSIQEDQLEFLSPLQVQARDTEAGSAAITYRIRSGNTNDNAFIINPNTGVITVRRTLNVEDTPNNSARFTLNVEASDNGNPPQFGTAIVRISVIDQNNYGPVLNPTRYNARISELAPGGTYVTTIKGTDQDFGDFGKITYVLGNNDFGNFLVDPNSGNVTVSFEQSFDYSLETSYEFTIIAFDGGSPQLSATATVFVSIIDENNENPFFDQPSYDARMVISAPIGTEILKLEATDNDVDKDLRYSIVDDSSYKARNEKGRELASSATNFKIFTIDERLGEIKTNAVLENTEIAEITFFVNVEDINGKSAQQTARASILVTVLGEPETDVVFLSYPVNSYVFEDSELENLPLSNIPILTIQAEDRKFPSIKPRYVKVAGSDFFSVDENTGEVRKAKKTDYELGIRRHELTIQAQSRQDDRSSQIEIFINVLNDNDNTPVFSQKIYEESLDETAKYPELVVQFQATDRDDNDIDPLEYSLSGPGSDDFFIFPKQPSLVTRIGELRVALNRDLDYNTRPMYNFTLVARDNPPGLGQTSGRRLTGQATVIIRLINLNNHDPEFRESSRSKQVPETAVRGDPILLLEATDKDASFARDDDTIRREVIRYSLRSFPNNEYSERALSLFTINARTGALSVRAENLLGLAGVYLFEVQAADWESVTRYGYMNVTIEVLSTQQDDGNPVWASPPVGTKLYVNEETENVPLTNEDGSSVIFSAESLNNSRIFFTLFNDLDGALIINEETGEITVVKKLDRETKATYNLLVYAVDESNREELRSGRPFELIIKDLDDNSETFYSNDPLCPPPLSQPFVVQVVERVPIGSVVAMLQACDRDDDINYLEYYPYSDEQTSPYCKENNERSALTVRTNGELVTNREIDFESTKNFVMCIIAVSKTRETGLGRKKRAFDASEIIPNENNIAYIDAQVMDLNDNGPKFYNKKEYAGIRVDHNDQIKVYTLQANDIDGPNFDDADYTFDRSYFYPIASNIANDMGSGNSGLFKLQQANIFLKSNVNLQPYSRGRFLLKVRARDLRDPVFTDIQDLNVYVYEPGQMMRVTVDKPVEEAYRMSDDVMRAMNSLDKYKFIFISTGAHRTSDGYDDKKSDIKFIAVNTDTHIIQGVRDVNDIFDNNDYRDRVEDAAGEKVEVGRGFPVRSSEESVKWRDLWWVLVVIGIFIFVCCLILVVTVLILSKRYKRYTKTNKSYLVPQ